MNCVILGAGSVGTHIAQNLSSEGADVVLIDSDPEVIRTASSRLDCMVLEGQIPNTNLLRQAKIETADYFIATTDSDEVNMISCGIVAAEFEKPINIARVRNIEYSRSHNNKKKFLNIDYIVNPDTEAADAILRSIEYGAIGEVFSFLKSDIQIRDFLVQSNSHLKGRSIEEIATQTSSKFLISSVLRNDTILIPSGDFIIQDQDLLYIAAHSNNFEEILASFGYQKGRIKRITIIGGGRIGQNILLRLSEGFHRSRGIFASLRTRNLKGLEVRIVDKDLGRCKQLAALFPHVLVLHADLSEEDVFLEEGLAESDLFIAVTDNQEFNIVVAQYAKTLGVMRSIALVIKNSYANIAMKLGIDVTLNKKTAVASSILRFIKGKNLKSFHSILEGKVEVLEIEITKDASACSKQVKDLPFSQSGALVVAISRGSEGDMIIPGGTERFEEGDSVILVAEREYFAKVESFFKGKSG